jgi:hypothetical protein
MFMRVYHCKISFEGTVTVWWKVRCFSFTTAGNRALSIAVTLGRLFAVVERASTGHKSSGELNLSDVVAQARGAPPLNLFVLPPFL